MDAGYVFWLFVVSFGASALGGMLGMASGIFIVPILTVFGHIDIHIAVGASIVSVIACSCGGAAPFLRGRLTNVRLVIVLETATTLGALSGVLISGLWGVHLTGVRSSPRPILPRALETGRMSAFPRWRGPHGLGTFLARQVLVAHGVMGVIGELKVVKT